LPNQQPQNNYGGQNSNLVSNQQRSQNVFVREIRGRIDDYFVLSLRNLRDIIPKQIGYFLVKMSQEKLQFELYTRLQNNKNITRQLGEPENVTVRRKQLQTIIKTLKDSLKVLQRDPDITAASMDDGELSEILRQEALARKNQMNNPNNRGPPPNRNMGPPNQGRGPPPNMQ